MKFDKYNVVYAADDNFTMMMGISIISLFENNKDISKIQLLIIDSGISDENKKRIEKICVKYKQPNPIWEKPVNIEELLEFKVKTDRGSMAQYSRIFIQRFFGTEEKRALYLDCDTLIVDSISELYEMDMDGKTVAVLKDAFSRAYRSNINLQKDDIMFNSGVMLIDLDKWKTQKIETKILDFIADKNGIVQQGDQGALNAILANGVIAIHPKFNMLSLFYSMTFKEILFYRCPVNFYTEKDIEEGKKNAVIIHFTSGFNILRPWTKGSEHRMKYYWMKYKEMSPWKNVEEAEDNRKHQILYCLYRSFPKKISLWLVSPMQVFGRPLKNKIISKFRSNNK